MRDATTASGACTPSLPRCRPLASVLVPPTVPQSSRRRGKDWRCWPPTATTEPPRPISCWPLGVCWSCTHELGRLATTPRPGISSGRCGAGLGADPDRTQVLWAVPMTLLERVRDSLGPVCPLERRVKQSMRALRPDEDEQDCLMERSENAIFRPVERR